MADEINRASPRTQAALLQAMQERKVTVAGHDHALPAPFHVLATQNPIEQEGTYPLPEAQLDRFFMQINVDYPSLEAERRMMIATTTGSRGRGRSACSTAPTLLAHAAAGAADADRRPADRPDPAPGPRRPARERDAAGHRRADRLGPGPARQPER